MKIIIRPYDPKIDNPYIYATWTKFAWYSPKDPIVVSKKEWFKHKITQIQHALQEGQVKIACIDETPDVIMGYIIVKDGKVEWMCVKNQFRDQGIETLLIKSIKPLLTEVLEAEKRETHD